jgi:hypothetical protein
MPERPSENLRKIQDIIFKMRGINNTIMEELKEEITFIDVLRHIDIILGDIELILSSLARIQEDFEEKFIPE